jgi:hypothetical protein
MAVQIAVIGKGRCEYTAQLKPAPGYVITSRYGAIGYCAIWTLPKVRQFHVRIHVCVRNPNQVSARVHVRVHVPVLVPVFFRDQFLHDAKNINVRQVNYKN